jgi:hypothetical protein
MKARTVDWPLLNEAFMLSLGFSSVPTFVGLECGEPDILQPLAESSLSHMLREKRAEGESSLSN